MFKRVYNIVDIHSHLMPNVDDGSPSLDLSLDFLKKQSEVGVKKVILTPHQKADIYNTPTSVLKESFLHFQSKAKESGIPIELYLGQEIYCDCDIYDNLKNNKILTLNDTKYLLLEFNYFVETDIADYVYNIKTLGYTPIIAHIERYTYLDWNTLYDLKLLGALLQVNASSITGESGCKIKKHIMHAIGKGMIDFVASDTHITRKTHLDKAYKIVSKTFGNKVADDLFYNNANNILIK